MGYWLSTWKFWLAFALVEAVLLSLARLTGLI
jgi:hypothetical protein